MRLENSCKHLPTKTATGTEGHYRPLIYGIKAHKKISEQNEAGPSSPAEEGSRSNFSPKYLTMSTDGCCSQKDALVSLLTDLSRATCQVIHEINSALSSIEKNHPIDDYLQKRQPCGFLKKTYG